MRLSLSNSRGWVIIRTVYFSLFYLYLWVVVKPHLIYYGCGEITNFPVFYKGWAFFNEVVPHPGGPIKYLSDFLSQLLYYSWAGALVLTVHALLICVFTGYYLKKIGITRPRIISIIPAFLLLITYNGYTYHFTTTLALLAALIFACTYVSIAPKAKVPNVLLFLFLSVVLYLIAAGAYLYFSLLCCIYEIFFRRRFSTGLLYGVLSVCIGYIIGVLIYKTSLIDAYTELLPFSWKIADYTNPKKMIEPVYALYLLIPFIVIVFALWGFFTQHRFFLLHIKGSGKAKSGKSKQKKVASDKSTDTDKTTASYKSKISVCFELLFLFAIAAGTVIYFFNSEQRAIFEVDYYLGKNQWKKVIEIGRHYQNNDHVVHALNRALYHLGLLPSDMFCYKQSMRSFMLSGSEEGHSPWNKIGTYYDLGAVNKCECVLADSLEKYGERPELIKKLAIVRIAKNDIPTARIYLEALNKTLFYSDWASDCLKRLDADPNMSDDKEIQRLRSVMLYEDKGELEFLIEEMFTNLLKRNPKNQMAFEYLMAFYMLLGDTDGFIQNIDRLDDFNYPQIPRHYQEAILSYIYLTKNMSDLQGRRINIKFLNRFKEFMPVVELYGTNRQAAYYELVKNYSDTYYFYYMYRVSGLQNE
jgi:hypothetical protein